MRFFLVVFLLCGCVSYGLNDLREAPRIRKSAAPYPLTVKVTATSYRETVGEPDSRLANDEFYGAGVSQRLQMSACRFLESSGMFRDVIPFERAIHDVALNVHVVSMVDPEAQARLPGLRLLSAVTLTVIPVWATDSFVLEVTAVDAKGQVIFDKKYRDRVRTLRWLPLALVRLFGAASDPNHALRNAALHAMRDFDSEFSRYVRERGM